MNIKYPFLIFLFLYPNFCFSGEYDYERMYSESNIALGIPAEARGNRFELLKASKASSDNGSSTLFGVTGSALGGLNPLSSSSFSVVTGLSALHSLLKSSKDKPARKTYKGFEQKNVFFSGLKLNQDDPDFIQSSSIDIFSKFNDSLLSLQEPDSKITQNLLPNQIKKDKSGNLTSTMTRFVYNTTDGYRYTFLVALKKLDTQDQTKNINSAQSNNPYNAKLTINIFHGLQNEELKSSWVNADTPTFAKISPVLQDFNEKIGSIIFSDDLRTIVFEGNVYTDTSI